MVETKLLMFGAPRLMVNGQRIEIRLRKSTALLVYLATTRRPHSREFLAALLWPESDHSKALGNLRRALYRVKHALGIELLTSTREFLQFNEDANVWTDIEAFGEHTQVGLAGAVSRERDQSEVIFHLKEAAGLYTNDFLSGFTLPDTPDFDEWQFFRTENLRDTFKEVLQQLVSLYRERGDWDEGIHYARRHVAVDPLDEAAQRSLMELYALGDQRAAALRQYEDCQRKLKKELGLTPEENTTALCAAIRRGEIRAHRGRDAYPIQGVEKRTADRTSPIKGTYPVVPPVEGRSEPEPVPSISANNHQRLAGDFSLPGPAHNLPARPYPFIGRKRELEEIKRMLLDGQEPRLLTLTGPGGIGKTQLALEVAAEARRAFPNGVYLIPMVSLSSADQIAPAIAESVGLNTYEGGKGGKKLFSFLRDKRLLLILDNYEYLLPNTRLVSDLLKYTEQVKLLVTSGERLNLRGEIVYALEGLSYPEDDREIDLRTYSAVQLLLQTAQMIRPQMHIGAEALRQAGRISRLVQGMPLALLLAASWVDVLSLEEIGDEITKSLDFLESHIGDLPERQLSMRATFVYSWERLLKAEQEAFMRLSVFRGGFTRQAASWVTGSGVRSLRSLANKSLILFREGARYDIHELLRQFGEEKLEESGQGSQIRDAQSKYYLRLLSRLSTSLKGGRQKEALMEIEAEFQNMRAAWKRAVQQGNSALLDEAVEALFLYCDIRWRQREGAELLAFALRALEAPAGEKASLLYGRLLMKIGLLMSRYFQDDPTIGKRIQEGLEIARKEVSIPDIAFGLLALGHFAADVSRDIPTALGYFEEAEEMFTVLGDDYYKARATHLIGHCHLCLSGIRDFEPHAQESLRLTQRIGDKANEAIFLAGLVLVDFFLEGPETAERHVGAARAAADEIGYGLALAQVNNFAGIFEMLRGNLDQAAKYLDTGLSAAREISFFVPILYALAAQGVLHSLKDQAEEGMTYIRECSVYDGDPYITQFAAWASAMTYASVDDFAKASQHIDRIISMDQRYHVENILAHTLPVISLLLARGGYPELAVEVLALANNHPLSYPGWIARWGALTAMQEELEAQLGRDAFQAAWSRGEEMDLNCALDNFRVLTRKADVLKEATVEVQSLQRLSEH